MQQRLFLFGRLPSTHVTGGVTTFTYNFLKAFPQINPILLDMYPDTKKKIPIHHKESHFFTGSLILRLWKIYLFTFKYSGTFFFNFSTTNGLLLLSLLPKKSNSQWVVMLHNGDLEVEHEKLSRMKKKLIAYASKRVDHWLSLSKKQERFFAKKSMSPIYTTTSHINISEDIGNTITSEALEARKIVGEYFNQDVGVRKKFIISGYPTKKYRHIETLKVFEELWKRGFRFNISLCLYGQDSDGIENIIKNYALSLPFVELYFSLDKDMFNYLLKQQDCYVRMNSVDSFGLAVAEAIEFGVDAIATNVCERYLGTYIIPVDDFDMLFKVLEQYIQGSQLKNILQQSIVSNVTSIDEIIFRILNS